MRLSLYLTFLGLGIACLLGALVVTRQSWRPDIRSFGSRSPWVLIALHPGRFARGSHLRTIRALNAAGALFILCALAIVGYDIVAAIRGRP